MATKLTTCDRFLPEVTLALLEGRSTAAAGAGGGMR